VVSGAGVLEPEELRRGDLAAFEPSSEEVEFEALTDTEFVLGSAAPPEHDLVLGSSEVTAECSPTSGGNQRARARDVPRMALEDLASSLSLLRSEAVRRVVRCCAAVCSPIVCPDKNR
jgi:hypothetical protein